MPQSARDQFTATLGEATGAAEVFGALHRLAAAEIGVRLFSVTLIDTAAGLARRVYTSDSAAYPLSGTKPLVENGFLATVRAGRMYHANSPREMRADFPDLAAIESLGCGAVINLPVMVAARLAATVNLLDAAGRYDPGTALRARQCLALPALAAVLAAERLGPARP
ncbi:GAF domain-containing protein [Frigidibacter sp. ROC022]|uniref:GAF domain-containing protein n=1 Tax=Frigidibacter sp. ROC022 TaxID=2971796 RepID=UPI00215A609B|nr:GAF domain-containing protein [Frigidibacter sp. ROC022]MCR8724339.1 GAF domain-containing protein [Frigidibacter sp. ROC022]